MITLNVREGAFAISLTGMSIVFKGLFLISITIRILTGILNWIALFEKLNQRDSTQQQSIRTGTSSEENNNDIVAAITLMLQRENKRQYSRSNNPGSHNIFGNQKN
ncbi:MAG: OadG family protein [Proteobacteria bacterium]|nr:OadG family protein [Pseudomonadota bacterium]